MSAFTVRPAAPGDDRALAEIDVLTWDTSLSVGLKPSLDEDFFAPPVHPDDVLVAIDRDGRPLGYVQLGNALPVPSHLHVIEIHGLAVDPGVVRRGIGGALLDAAIAEARARGARRVTLRVIGANLAARRLYESRDFVVQGILREEFRTAAGYVDDVLMALALE